MKLLTSDDLCDQLKMKKSTLYQMTCAKKIPHLKIGGFLRFDQDQIDEWLEKQSVAPIDVA